jgi:hypothetical protein
MANPRNHFWVRRLLSTYDIALQSLYSFSLVEIIKHNPGPQMSYQVGFCLWLLSFEQNIAEQINK